MTLCRSPSFHTSAIFDVCTQRVSYHGLYVTFRNALWDTCGYIGYNIVHGTFKEIYKMAKTTYLVHYMKSREWSQLCIFLLAIKMPSQRVFKSWRIFGCPVWFIFADFVDMFIFFFFLETGSQGFSNKDPKSKLGLSFSRPKSPASKWWQIIESKVKNSNHGQMYFIKMYQTA